MCGRTCEPTGLSQQEGAPGHEEKQGRLQQREVPQLRKLGHVIQKRSSRSKTESRHATHSVTQTCTDMIPQLEGNCFKASGVVLVPIMHTWQILEHTMRCYRGEVKGYESRHDSCSHPESERSTEDAQEDAEGLQQSHGLEAVAVVSGRLVRHDGAAGWTHRYAGTDFQTHSWVLRLLEVTYYIPIFRSFFFFYPQ